MYNMPHNPMLDAWASLRPEFLSWLANEMAKTRHRRLAKENGLTDTQRKHGERIAYRRSINGQPNGYKPTSEAELKREREGRRIINGLNDIWFPEGK